MPPFNKGLDRHVKNQPRLTTYYHAKQYCANCEEWRPSTVRMQKRGEEYVCFPKDPCRNNFAICSEHGRRRKKEQMRHIGKRFFCKQDSKCFPIPSYMTHYSQSTVEVETVLTSEHETCATPYTQPVTTSYTLPVFTPILAANSIKKNWVTANDLEIQEEEDLAHALAASLEKPTPSTKPTFDELSPRSVLVKAGFTQMRIPQLSPQMRFAVCPKPTANSLPNREQYPMEVTPTTESKEPKKLTGRAALFGLLLAPPAPKIPLVNPPSDINFDTESDSDSESESDLELDIIHPDEDNVVFMAPPPGLGVWCPYLNRYIPAPPCVSPPPSPTFFVPSAPPSHLKPSTLFSGKYRFHKDYNDGVSDS